MADRLLVFGDPEVQKLLNERFVAVTGDDWYQRQKEGVEGEFFQKVVGQGPRTGSGTRQGHYVFTAQGKLLGFNNNRGPERRIAMMKEALAKWETLPEDEKKGTVPDAKVEDGKFQRTLPEGAQVIKVSTRALEKSEDGLVAMGPEKVGNQTAVDHLWLKKEEVTELQKLVVNGGGDFPDWFAMRLLRFHLRDNTRGEPEDWKRDDLKQWTLVVDAKGQVSGRFEVRKSSKDLGFEGKIQGSMAFGQEGFLTTFEWLVQGEQWGDGNYTQGSRPGKSPLGIVLQLSKAEEPRDQIPPQGIRWEEGYWKAQD